MFDIIISFTPSKIIYVKLCTVIYVTYVTYVTQHIITVKKNVTNLVRKRTFQRPAFCV